MSKCFPNYKVLKDKDTIIIIIPSLPYMNLSKTIKIHLLLIPAFAHTHTHIYTHVSIVKYTVRFPFLAKVFNLFYKYSFSPHFRRQEDKRNFKNR